MRVAIDVADKRIEDLLCNAFEGGSNYWYVIIGKHYPNKCPKCNSITLDSFCTGGKDRVYTHKRVETVIQTKDSLGIEFEHTELSLKGGWLTIVDGEDDEAEEYNLTREAIERGVKVMAEDYSRHFGDWLGENDDAITGDVFLQCCLFGKVIYG